MSFFHDLYDKARDKFRLRKLRESYSSDVPILDQYKDGYDEGYKKGYDDGYKAACRDNDIKEEEGESASDGIPPPMS